MNTRNSLFSVQVIYALCLLIFSVIIHGCHTNTAPIKTENEPRNVGPDLTVLPPPGQIPESVPPVTPPNVQHAQHALVVAINQYKYADGLHLTNLNGTVNDAYLLRDALRSAQVQLPDERVLLDTNATRAAFMQAWQNLLAQAQPGDTLILTFSGHGGQQTDTVPLGEKDHKDETLLFHDFNPQQPTQGRITDDELYDLFKKASDYQIIFIVDACHSSGMVRSGAKPSGKIRYGGFWNIQPISPPSLQSGRLIQEDSGKPLPHVTLITAVEYDQLLVQETVINGKWHGALSWYFVKALKGDADGNQNGFLERSELNRFLQVKVRNEMNYMQTPKLVPSQEKSVIKLPSGLATPSPALRSNFPNIVVLVENAPVPSGLKHARFVSSPQGIDLRFVVTNRWTDVFNNTGDKLITLPSNMLKLWQPVIDKARLLKALATQFDMRLTPIRITLREGDGLHKETEILHFNIEPGDKQQSLNALTLFNLTGDGKLQFVYPLIHFGHPKVVRNFPYTLSMEVAPPFGGDNLVAVLCKKPATGLHTLLAEIQPNIPEPEQILSQFRQDNNRCQVGQYAFFSSE
jgi:hypothetical protein